MKKISTLVLGLGLAGSAFAASTGTSYKTLDKIKKNSSMSLSNYLYSTKGKTDRTFSTNDLYVYNGYKVNGNNSLTLETRIRTTGFDSSDTTIKSSTDVGRVRLHWTRSGLATEAKHGVNWSLGYTRAQFVSSKARIGAKINGYHRFKTGLSKSVLNKKLRLAGTYYYYNFDRRNSDTVGAGSSLHLFSFSQSYSITDKFSAYLSEDFGADRVKNAGQIGDNGSIAYNKANLGVEFGLGYQVTDSFSAGLAVSNTLFAEHDKKGLLTDGLLSDATYSFSLGFSVF